MNDKSVMAKLGGTASELVPSRTGFFVAYLRFETRVHLDITTAEPATFSRPLCFMEAHLAVENGLIKPFSYS